MKIELIVYITILNYKLFMLKFIRKFNNRIVKYQGSVGALRLLLTPIPFEPDLDNTSVGSNT